MAAASPKSFQISFFLVYAFWVLMCTVSGETCEKTDICSCKLSNGKKVSLWDVDGGKNNPSFTDIPQDGKTKNTFDWNPCSPFSKLPDCSNVLVCQLSGGLQFTTGTTDTSFTVDSGGNVHVTYGNYTKNKYDRRTIITLKCDPSQEGKGSIPELVQTKEGSDKSIYSGIFTSKHSCPVSSGLSVGSILLIIFFCLVVVYLIVGVLINRYYRGTRNFPEILPNSSFWADFPFLVKDGIVFTSLAVKSGCRGLCQKCNKNSYSEI